ncbi:MAG: hypothetical protein V7727_14565 [Sneathiella sp.]
MKFLKNTLKILTVGTVCLSVSACFDPDKEDLLKKVKGLTHPEQIVTAIGPANKVIDDGALKYWRYSAAGGDVCFSVVGSMALRMAC